MPAWIVPEAQREPSPSRSHFREPVRLAVVHGTVSPAKDYAVRGGADERRIRAWLKRGGSVAPKKPGGVARASTHLVILRDGMVIQGVPLNRAAWHAGESIWRGAEGVNGFSVGIDLENVGPLKMGRDGPVDAYGAPFSGPVFSLPTGQIYEQYTDAQVDAVCSLAIDLVAVFPILGDAARWVGHSDVSPGRKWDPWRPFPWRRLRRAVSAAAGGECLDVDDDDDGEGLA